MGANTLFLTAQSVFFKRTIRDVSEDISNRTFPLFGHLAQTKLCKKFNRTSLWQCFHGGSSNSVRAYVRKWKKLVICGSIGSPLSISPPVFQCWYYYLVTECRNALFKFWQIILKMSGKWLWMTSHLMIICADITIYSLICLFTHVLCCWCYSCVVFSAFDSVGEKDGTYWTTARRKACVVVLISFRVSLMLLLLFVRFFFACFVSMFYKYKSYKFKLRLVKLL